MEFKRKKRRGISQKTQKLWLSREGYRISWRREVFGVQVPAAYRVCVRTVVPGDFIEDGKPCKTRVMWDSVNDRRRLIKTLKAAIEACECHYKLWTKAAQCTGVRSLCEVIGRYPFGVPEWVAGKMNRRVLVTVFDTTPNRHERYAEDDEEELAAPPTETEPKKSKQQNNHRKKGGLNERHRQHLRIRGSTTD